MQEVKLSDLIQTSQPSRGLSHMGMFVLAALGLLLLTMFISQDEQPGAVIQSLLGFAICAALILVIIMSEMRRQTVAKWSRRASDLCLMEKWNQAAEPLQMLLRKPVPSSQIRYQALLELAGVAEHTQRLGEAEQIYQAIAKEQPRGLLGGLATLGRSITLLKLNRLADAESVLRPLEISAQQPPFRALVLLGRLYQQIRTGHYREALENESTKCETARLGLSTKAAFVYGLLALAHQQLSKYPTSEEEESGDSQRHIARAKELWLMATMLIRPDNLSQKFAELTEIAQTFTPAPGLPEVTSAPEAEDSPQSEV